VSASEQMRMVIRKLSLGFGLILLASVILLISDRHQRTSGAQRIPRVAIFQCASQSVLDDSVRGIKESLAAAGYVHGKNIDLRQFNAENDMATANAIAKQIIDGQFDFVLTVTTVCLQVVANANKAGKTTHIFGVVTDPFVAGVGLDRANPLQHPRHLVGFGTFQPVEETFRLAKKLHPGLEAVGIVWNTAEASSEACTRKARNIAPELGIKLLEANVENSAGVLEAAAALTGRGAQALWVGCDLTVNVALESMVAAARKARIPVFTNSPPSIKQGALFDLGANFHEVGKKLGELAVKVIGGADPASIPIENIVPLTLTANKMALKDLREPWTLPQEILAQADTFIDENGVRQQSKMAIAKPPEGRIFKVGLAYFAPEAGADVCIEGLFSGLKDLGFVEGKNLRVRKAHAQAEIINIPSMLQNFDNEDVELIITMTTPVLTAAVNAVKKKPVVFTYVYDPIAAGAGKSAKDHVPNITGTGSFPPVSETLDAIQELVPGVRAVGTLYNSSEANSRKVISVGRELFEKRGIGLEEVTITNTSEVFQAAQALTTRKIQALWVTGDNTAIQAFEGIAKVAADSRLPLIINDPEFTERGALAAVGIGWKKTCYEAAKRVTQVLLGESPQGLPFENIAIKKIVLNHSVARKLGITFPREMIQAADAN
jgi:ABC-type uncharacterized transport system substrate-binding protein